MKEDFKKLIYEGLRKAKSRNLDIFTIALYHDHESHVATVCIDTIESSKRSVMSSNEFTKKYFLKQSKKVNWSQLRTGKQMEAEASHLEILPL